MYFRRRTCWYARSLTLAVTLFFGVACASRASAEGSGPPPLEPKSADTDQDGASDTKDRPWFTNLELGAQFLPNYQEGGASGGLSEQRFFGRITADGVWNAPSPCSKSTRRVHLTIELELRGAAIELDEGMSMPDTSPNDFDDIADALGISTSLFWALAEFDDHTSELGLLIGAGGVSREKLTEDGDVTNWHYRAGVRYVYADYRAGNRQRNGRPRGWITLAAARFEDYAGLGRKSRFVAEASMALPSEAPIFVGFLGNFGDGQDEMAVTVTYHLKPDSLLNLFAKE